MVKKQLFFLLTLMMAFTACVKETYDMKKLSKEISYSPTFGMSAASGEILLSDVLKPNDTVVFDTDKTVRIIIRQDSVINLKLKDFYDLTNMVTYNSVYKIGEMTISDFSSTYNLKLEQIANTLSAPLKTVIQGLYGTNSPFPAFPQTDLPDLPFATMPNFTDAVFASGNIQLTVKNNLPVTMNGLTIKLLNVSDRSQIGNTIDMASIAPGATLTAVIDLTGKRVTNNIIAVVTQKGSPGSVSAVPIDKDKSIDISILGSLLKVSSGHVKIPPQLVFSVANKDTISFNPGTNVEIEKFRITTGNLSYTLTSRSQIRASFVMTLPSTDRSGSPVSETILVTNPNTVKTGTFSLNNTTIDLGTKVKHPYNLLPISYAITINSNDQIIAFDSNDNLNIEFKLSNPNFDWVKGYFGQIAETIQPDSVDFNMGDFMDKITGEYHISDPSIIFNYSNSFAIPIKVALDVKGRKTNRSVDLGLSPFNILYPTGIITRDVSSTFVINNANSAIANLISLPPTFIKFGGSASMNPGGMAAIGGRTNYVFGNSRFLGSMEVQVPLKFWINNLQFSDTLDNFLSSKDSGNNSFSPSDMDYTSLDVTVNNGFPLGVSLKMILYDSVAKDTLKSVRATNLLTPAPVDASGVVTGKATSVTRFEVSTAFFDAAKKADKIIFVFTLKTTDGATEKDIKILSDYSISFSAAVVVKPVINLK